jgi:hypothetical protein
MSTQDILEFSIIVWNERMGFNADIPNDDTHLILCEQIDGYPTRL